jgi:hypothetical protein
MSLPLPPNTTCDIYRVGVAPPASPAVAGVRGHLRGDWRLADHAKDANWTHILLVDAAVDLRDAYTGALFFAEQDSVYIPDQGGTRFKVVFIERVDAGTANEHKRAYLDRQTPAWPSDDL